MHYVLFALLLATFIILVVCTGGIAIVLLRRSDPTRHSRACGGEAGTWSRP